MLSTERAQANARKRALRSSRVVCVGRGAAPAAALCGACGAARRPGLSGCAAATIVGTITAVGGGTVRDILLGHEQGRPKRAFWIDEPE